MPFWRVVTTPKTTATIAAADTTDTNTKPTIIPPGGLNLVIAPRHICKYPNSQQPTRRSAPRECQTQDNPQVTWVLATETPPSPSRGVGPVIVIGAVAAGFVVAADTPTALPFIVAVPFGLVGGVMAQIGIIGWGVALGIRQTEQRHASPQRVPEQTQSTQPSQPPTLPTQRPDPNLPPWDQPEGRSYR